MMGFQNFVFRNPHSHVLSRMESIYKDLVPIENHFKTIKRGACVRHVFFSDSILLISNDNSENALSEILFNSTWILGNSLKHGIPMKGAIALGQQTADFDRSLHFGKPLIDAFNLQNELAFYGVTIHDTVEKKFDLKTHLLHRYKTPLKSGSVNHWVVDWRQIAAPKKEPRQNALLMSFQEEKNHALLALEGLYKTVSGTARHYVDNTIEYVKWADSLQKK